MNDHTSSRRAAERLALALAAVLAIGFLCPPSASAQVPPRFYWKTLSGANAVPVIYNSMSGNTNPFDPAHIVSPGADIEATMAIAGYARTFTLFDRAAMAAVLLPMGRISGEVTTGALSATQTARGFGDPTFELNVNLIGPKAQKNLADVAPYQPGFSLDVIVDLAVPIGEYDDTRQLNLGQNRWYGRVGAPIVWQLGPGRRPPDTGLHKSFLGFARRRLVHGGGGDDPRGRGREARQPGGRADARLPGQRQPGPHLRLQVDH